MSPTSNDHPLATMVRRLGQWTRLDQDDEQAILALPHTVRSLPPSGYLVREGETPTHACVLLAGYAIRHKVVGNGGRQILSIHMKNDLVDLQNLLLGTADHNVQALSQLEVAAIPREAVIRLAQSRPAVGLAMWYDTLVDASIHREWIANVGRRDARTRLAHLLCEFGVRLEVAGLGSKRDYELPMTQEQIGDAAGLTTVHVNRTLMAFDAQGLTQRSRRAVVIKDWNALAAVGDFNAAYLHLETAPLPG